MTVPSSPISVATTSGRTWDDAESPAAARLARRFEDDWRRAPASSRPDPASYLPDDPDDRPGAWLALLRAELGLRWDAGDRATVEQYLRRYPDLDDQTAVALLYEEYCLREEAGESPDQGDFERRFPGLASQLRRVLDIHALVGGSRAPTLGGLGSTLSTTGQERTEGDGPGRASDRVEFPEAGETIGGFRLAEELGRGSFARVYLAHERLLADRPVALKVATTGSREPQTLARLQHTHIVPVHSYRVDPVTKLHLLCMPYFGRTTLADLLTDPATSASRSGVELLAVLDRLEPTPSGLPRSPTAARKALAGRSFSGAMAWWGARLAEALQHAHDRGVLHRDVKPTNVLVTGDGLPMLLDFNLAMGPVLGDGDEESAKVGGTLAYMAPEHIEALADGIDAGVDARADVFALGVVLFEAIAGERPFPVVRSARSVAEALFQTAEQRRAGPPRLRRCGRPVSPALEAVVRRSLEADPGRRYQSAAELAADLQAVADDGPLRFAVEPLGSRSVRWLRRNRLRFAVSAPALVAAAILVETMNGARVRLREARWEVGGRIEQADQKLRDGELEAAILGFESAMDQADKHHSLAPLWRDANQKRIRAERTLTMVRLADAFFEGAERLRYRLFGFVDPERPPDQMLGELLGPFRVAEDPDWAADPDLDRLDSVRRRRLREEVPQLLFLRAVHLWLSGERGPSLAEEVARLRDQAVRAMPLDDPRRSPWEALCRDVGATRPAVAPAPGATSSTADRPRLAAESYFLWGIEQAARFQGTGDPDDASHALAYLEAAARGRPDAYWPRFYLATFALESGRAADALRHADAAVALNPSSPWALFNRALASWTTGDSASALGDLQAAAVRIPAGDRDRLRERIDLNIGLIRMERGDPEGARVALRSVLGDAPAGVTLGRSAARSLAASARPDGPGLAGPVSQVVGLSALSEPSTPSGSQFERAARLNLARLDAEQGHTDRAMRSYGDLLLDDPGHRKARLGRAVLLLSIGDADAAEADADALVDADLRGRPGRGGRIAAVSPAELAEGLELRARCRLATGRAEAALADALAALAAAPTPARDRLRLRALLATRPGHAIRLDDPSALDLLPTDGLAVDVRHAAIALATPPPGPEPSPMPRMLTRAALLSAAGEAEGAEQVATDAVLMAPDAALPRLVRARVRHRIGDRIGALADLDAALGLQPDDPDVLALRGLLLAESGRPADGLADLDRARSLGRDVAELHRARALALSALGRDPDAVAALTEALSLDPQDPRLALSRARLHLRGGRPSAARADLDLARSWSVDRPELRALVDLARSLAPPPPGSPPLASAGSPGDE